MEIQVVFLRGGVDADSEVDGSSANDVFPSSSASSSSSSCSNPRGRLMDRQRDDTFFKKINFFHHLIAIRVEKMDKIVGHLSGMRW